MPEELSYHAGDKTFVQRPLVLGQWRQLIAEIKGVAIPADATTETLIEIFGDRITNLLAIVLTEQDKSPRDKNLAELAMEIEFGVTPEQVVQIVDDFFACNPIASVLERIGGMAERITATMTGSKRPASSSVLATSQSETQSSGDTP